MGRLLCWRRRLTHRILGQSLPPVRASAGALCLGQGSRDVFQVGSDLGQL
jgi:hypothetical protein